MSIFDRARVEVLGRLTASNYDALERQIRSNAVALLHDAFLSWHRLPTLPPGADETQHNARSMDVVWSLLAAAHLDTAY